MSPRRRAASSRAQGGRQPGGREPWAVIYYMAPDGSVPALKFLDGCPGKIDAEFTAVLDAVAAGPTASVLRGRQVGGHARLDERLV